MAWWLGQLRGGAMAQQLQDWIPNPGVSGSKPLGGPNVGSAFHPPEFDHMSIRDSWGFSG